MKSEKKSWKKSEYKKVDVYQMITDIIIEKLEKGTVMWKKPWKYTPEGNIPRNYITKSPYNGFNLFFLSSFQFENQFFLTCKQANDLGGKVKAKSKGIPVVYWSVLYYDADNKIVKTEKEAVKSIPLLKYYTVFNVEQIEGVEFEFPIYDQQPEFNPIQACENIITEMVNKPSIKNDGGNNAFYNVLSDSISMPNKEHFVNAESYYKVLFHELVHSTGASKRLNRKEITDFNSFGSDSYSKEELTAEFGASFICALTGIDSSDNIEQSASYIKGWLKALKDDKTLLVAAAGRAQKAVDYIINKTQSQQIAA